MGGCWWGWRRSGRLPSRWRRTGRRWRGRTRPTAGRRRGWRRGRRGIGSGRGHRIRCRAGDLAAAGPGWWIGRFRRTRWRCRPGGTRSAVLLRRGSARRTPGGRRGRPRPRRRRPGGGCSGRSGVLRSASPGRRPRCVRRTAGSRCWWQRSGPGRGRARLVGVFVSGPPASLASPIRASDVPSIAPSAAGPVCRVEVRKVGSKLVAISCSASLKNDAAPTLAAPGVSHPRAGDAGTRRSSWSSPGSTGTVSYPSGRDRWRKPASAVVGGPHRHLGHARIRHTLAAWSPA